MDEMKKVLMFYNPNAGNGLFKSNLDTIIQRFQERNLFVIPLRAGEPKNLDLAMAAVSKDPTFDRVIAAGGDGTMNIVVNAMKRHNVNVPLVVFPAGTANDFAYYLDIPTDIDGMINVALNGEAVSLDIGKVNERYFVNVAAMGSMVDLSQRTNPGMKNALGVMAYYLKGLGEITHIKALPFKVESEEFSGTEKLYFMVVIIGVSAGGFRKLAADSNLCSGTCEVLMFKEMPVTEYLGTAVNVLQGKHYDNKNVIYFKTRKLRIEADESIGTDVDGEKGEKFPLDIEVIQSGLKVYVAARENKDENNAAI